MVGLFLLIYSLIIKTEVPPVKPISLTLTESTIQYIKQLSLFCPKCGAELDRQKEGKAKRSDGARILLLIFGGIILLVAFGLLVGGGTLLLLNTSLADTEDFLTTESYQLIRDSYAIAFQDIHIDVGEFTGTWGM